MLTSGRAQSKPHPWTQLHTACRSDAQLKQKDNKGALVQYYPKVCFTAANKSKEHNHQLPDQISALYGNSGPCVHILVTTPILPVSQITLFPNYIGGLHMLTIGGFFSTTSLPANNFPMCL